MKQGCRGGSSAAAGGGGRGAGAAGAVETGDGPAVFPTRRVQSGGGGGGGSSSSSSSMQTELNATPSAGRGASGGETSSGSSRGGGGGGGGGSAVPDYLSVDQLSAGVAPPPMHFWACSKCRHVNGTCCRPVTRACVRACVLSPPLPLQLLLLHFLLTMLLEMTLVYCSCPLLFGSRHCCLHLNTLDVVHIRLTSLLLTVLLSLFVFSFFRVTIIAVLINLYIHHQKGHGGRFVSDVQTYLQPLHQTGRASTAPVSTRPHTPAAAGASLR